MTKSRCEYLSEVFPDFKPIYDRFNGHPGAGKNQQGYGRRIPTDYKIQIGSTRYRVYCCCFSNAGTCYINTKEHKFLVVLNGDLLSVR